jgi:4-hydroxybenzoate polyprenyltransferase
MSDELSGWSFARRWRTYFAERFPVIQNAVVIAAFVTGVASFGIRMRNGEASFAPLPWSIAFVTVFLFFLQLRIHDEFKDFEDDRRWRPYRPVPRGVVSLAELGWLWGATALIQILLALGTGPIPAGWMVAVWAYSWLMRVEFFAPAWLKARPVAYMVSHIVIVPLMTLYVLACMKLSLAASWQGLVPLLAMSYTAFFIVEIGRKIRAPEDEEPGVETYSALWGRATAVIAWLAALALTGVLAIAAGRQVGTARLATLAGGLLLLAALVVAVRFLRAPARGRGILFQIVSGISIIVLYLAVGDGFNLSRYLGG